MEDGTPFLFWLEIDEVLGVEEACGVGAVVGAAGLADDLGDLREAGHDEAGLVGEVDGGGGAGGGREGATDPDGAFVEVGEEFRADGAAEGEVDGDGEEDAGDGEGDAGVPDGGGDGGAVVAGSPGEEGIFPFFCAVAEEDGGEDGGDDDGEDEGADEGEGDGPGHGLEEAAFDGLEGEDGQVAGDDDAAGEEDGALDLVGCVADALDGGAGVVGFAEVADYVLDHDDGAVNDHAEVERAEGEEICGDVAEVEADGGKEQREGDGEGDDDGAADVAEEEEEDERDEEDAFEEVVLDGFDGVADELGAVKEGNDFYAGREDVLVELGDFVVDACENGVGVVAFLEEDDALDGVVVVYDGAVGAVGGAADLAEADFGALLDGRDVADAEGGAVLGLDDGVFNVGDGVEEAEGLDVDLLGTLLNEAAAAVGVVVLDLLLDLGE